MIREKIKSLGINVDSIVKDISKFYEGNIIVQCLTNEHPQESENPYIIYPEVFLTRKCQITNSEINLQDEEKKKEYIEHLKDSQERLKILASLLHQQEKEIEEFGYPKTSCYYPDVEELENIIKSDVVHLFMKQHGISKYTINDDGTVDVDGNVDVFESDLIDGRLPFKFGKVSGDFDCTACDLTSLEGCPQKIAGYFACSYNKLSSLEGSPREVGSNFNCGFNQLTSLDGCPQEVGGLFDCKYNNKRFTESDVKSACEKIGGKIYC